MCKMSHTWWEEETVDFRGGLKIDQKFYEEVEVERTSVAMARSSWGV